MKKLLAFVLVLCLMMALAGCGDVLNITVEEPAKIMVEKAGGTLALTLTDPKTVEQITTVVCKLPLKEAQSNGDDWTYRITFQDAEGVKLTSVTLVGGQLQWEGKTYGLTLGVDLSGVTKVLDELTAQLPTLPGGK